jgi:hypothetical protein
MIGTRHFATLLIAIGLWLCGAENTLSADNSDKLIACAGLAARSTTSMPFFVARNEAFPPGRRT